MISIKNFVAAIALGTALVATPALAVTHATKTNSVTHKHTKAHTPTHKHLTASKTGKNLHTKHVTSSKNTAHKKPVHVSNTGWKHHHSL